jgi:general secretion pathway protein I
MSDAVKNKSDGFTFLEVMVSLCLVAIVFISVYKMNFQSIRMADTAGFYSTAPLLAQQKLAEIDAFMNESDRDMENSGTFDENFSDYRWHTRIEDVRSEILGVEISKDLKKIIISVYSNNDKRSYHLTAYRFLRSEDD